MVWYYPNVKLRSNITHILRRCLVWCESQIKKLFMLKLVDIILMLIYDKISHIFYIEIVDIMLKSNDEIVYVEMGWYYPIVKLQ